MSDEHPRRVEFDDRTLIVRAEITVSADLSAVDVAVRQVLGIAGERPQRYRSVATSPEEW